MRSGFRRLRRSFYVLTLNDVVAAPRRAPAARDALVYGELERSTVSLVHGRRGPDHAYSGDRGRGTWRLVRDLHERRLG